MKIKKREEKDPTALMISSLIKNLWIQIEEVVKVDEGKLIIVIGRKT
jgi:hypothetical protein